jgi:flagellar biosynthetic protein FlhB
MAEQDDSSKTEEPTSKRLAKSREEGQVAVSQDVKAWGVLLAGTLALAFLMPAAAGNFLKVMVGFIDAPEDIAFDVQSLPAQLLALMLEVGWLVAPSLAALVLVAILAGVVQVGLLWAPKKIKPDWKKLSPTAGIKRLFSTRALVEFVKGLIKIAVVTSVAVMVALPLTQQLELSVTSSVLGSVNRMQDLIVTVCVGTVAVMTIVAAVDYVYQRLMMMRQLRMTKQEVRDEHKHSEGDPHIKARIRRLRLERARKRMMAAVPNADVVITNPTHYAVALAYDMEAMNAPKLVAKGVDLVAKRIRDVATEHGVPIVENPPVARALYASVELDEEIPPEHYQAVAQVIGYVMRLKKERLEGVRRDVGGGR